MGRRSISMRRSPGVQLVSAWSPPSVAGNTLWLQSNRGVTTATGVSAWTGSNAAANVFVQSDTTKQPAYDGTPQMPHADGANDALTCNDVIDAKTFGLRYKLDVVPGSGAFARLMCLVTAAPRVFNSALVANSANYQPLMVCGGLDSSNVNYVGAAVTPDTNWAWALFTYNGGDRTSVGSYTIDYRGVAQTVIANTGPNALAATFQGSLFATVSSVPASASCTDGIIDKVIAYSTVLTGSDRAAANAWLSVASS